MLKESGKLDQMTFPGLDGPQLYSPKEADIRLNYILSKFKASHKTESSFYITFVTLDESEMSFMKNYFCVERDFDVFKRLLKTFVVRSA
ncbi:MAG: hypothetical protein ACYTFW_24865 [Planctomycetota bacterium]